MRVFRKDKMVFAFRYRLFLGWEVWKNGEHIANMAWKDEKDDLIAKLLSSGYKED